MGEEAVVERQVIVSLYQLDRWSEVTEEKTSRTVKRRQMRGTGRLATPVMQGQSSLYSLLMETEA